jgi:hypothetical protein
VRLRPAFPNSGSVSTSMKKRLAFWWIVANTLAWTIGIVFVLPDLWAWIVCGAIVGTAQWLVLHRSLRLSPAWIAATCLAWTAGIWAGRLHADGLFAIPDPYWVFITGGTLSGFTQSCFLWRRVSRPALWVPSMIAGSILGWVVGAQIGALFGGDLTAGILTAGAVMGVVIGAASTPQLLTMLRHPEPRQEAV